MSSEKVAENSSVCLRDPRQLEDPLDVGHEAHVQHAVRLVEHEDLDLAEVGGPLADEVEQPAGRGDEDLDAGPQLLDLGIERDAAVDHGRAQRHVPAVGLDALGDLHGELARRRQDEAADRVPGRRERRVRVRPEAVEDRQGERGRLAGAGLCGGEDVAAPRAPMGWPVPGPGSARCSPPRSRSATGRRTGQVRRSARSFRFSELRSRGRRPSWTVSYPTRRPPGCAGAAATTGRAEHTRQWPHGRTGDARDRGRTALRDPA